MSSIREQIVVAAVVALNTARPVGVPEAKRARTKSLNLSNADTILVYPVDDPAEDVGGKRGPLIKRSLRLVIECVATETDDLSPDQAVDPYLVWVVNTLADHTLGGLANFLRESGTEFQYRVAETAYCFAAVTMTVQYQHRAGDIEQRT